MARAYRVDRMDSAALKVMPGPAGAMLVEGIVARPGIYEYRRADGSVRRELVPRDALWRDDSIATLARTPVTVEHPTRMVTPDNVSSLGHGDVDGEIVREVNDFVKIRMAVRTRMALDAVRSGKAQLSPGYIVELDERSGIDPEFGRFDAVQVRRLYNHVAICDAARGGPEMALARFDSAGEDVEVLVGGPEVPVKPIVDTARAYLERADAAKALVTDSILTRIEADKALQAWWTSFWQTHEAVRAEVAAALDLPTDVERESALRAIQIDLPTVYTDLMARFADTVAAITGRLDAVPAPPKAPAAPQEPGNEPPNDPAEPEDDGEDPAEPEDDGEDPAEPPAAPVPPPAPISDLTVAALKAEMEQFKAEMADLIGKTLSQAISGRADSSFDLDSVRLDAEALASDLGVGYSTSMKAGEIARAVIQATLPRTRLDSDVEVATAIKILRAMPAARYRKDSKVALIETPTIYGPQGK